MSDSVIPAVLLVAFLAIAIFVGTFPCLRLLTNDEDEPLSLLPDEGYHPLCDCPPPSNINKSTSTETLLTNIIDNCESSTQTHWQRIAMVSCTVYVAYESERPHL